MNLKSSMNMKDIQSPIGPRYEEAIAGSATQGTYISQDGTFQISVFETGRLSWKSRDTSIVLSALRSWEYEKGTQTLILDFVSGQTIRFLKQALPDTPTGASSTESSTVSEPSPQSGLKSSNALDVQVGGNHYKSFKLQPAEFIHMNNIGFLEGNVIKYVCRHAAKNGKADLEKARHYIDLLLELEYNNKNAQHPTS